jgi:WD domain, G-beta repeat
LPVAVSSPLLFFKLDDLGKECHIVAYKFCATSCCVHPQTTEHLKARGHVQALRALEHESGLTTERFGDDVMFLRSLILDGRWDDAALLLNPLRRSPFAHEKAAFELGKQRFLELLDSKSETVGVEGLVAALQQLEHRCTQREFHSLCFCLTLPSVSAHADFAQWTVHRGRLWCFEAILQYIGTVFVGQDTQCGRVPRGRLAALCKAAVAQRAVAAARAEGIPAPSAVIADLLHSDIVGAYCSEQDEKSAAAHRLQRRPGSSSSSSANSRGEPSAPVPLSAALRASQPAGMRGAINATTTTAAGAAARHGAVRSSSAAPWARDEVVGQSWDGGRLRGPVTLQSKLDLYSSITGKDWPNSAGADDDVDNDAVLREHDMYDDSPAAGNGSSSSSTAVPHHKQQQQQQQQRQPVTADMRAAGLPSPRREQPSRAPISWTHGDDDTDLLQQQQQQQQQLRSRQQQREHTSRSRSPDKLRNSSTQQQQQQQRSEVYDSEQRASSARSAVRQHTPRSREVAAPVAWEIHMTPDSTAPTAAVGSPPQARRRSRTSDSPSHAAAAAAAAATAAAESLQQRRRETSPRGSVSSKHEAHPLPAAAYTAANDDDADDERWLNKHDAALYQDSHVRDSGSKAADDQYPAAAAVTRAQCEQYSSLKPRTAVTLTPSTVLQGKQPMRVAAFDPSGRYFAAGSNDRSLAVCSVPSAAALATAAAAVTAATTTAANDDAHTDGEHSSEVPAATATVAQEFQQHHGGSVYCLAWSSDGQLIATGSNDKNVKVVRFKPDAARSSSSSPRKM